MSNETRRSTGRYDWGTLAVDALELARLMPPGPERNEALKLASLTSVCCRCARVGIRKARQAAKVDLLR